MANTGQLDGLVQNEPDGQDPEPSNRQEVKMMRGLIYMMKQQLKEMEMPPSSTKEPRDTQGDHEVRRKE
eukprot:12902026-Prorocentrum_lima.AAC.1